MTSDRRADRACRPAVPGGRLADLVGHREDRVGHPADLACRQVVRVGRRVVQDVLIRSIACRSTPRFNCIYCALKHKLSGQKKRENQTILRP